MAKCKLCGKKEYIKYSSLLGPIPVCHYHYKVKLVEEIEATEAVLPICVCSAEMRFNGLNSLGDTVLVNFICLRCTNTKTERRNIDSYFKKR